MTEMAGCLRKLTRESGAKRIAAVALLGVLVVVGTGIAGAAPLGVIADFGLSGTSSPRAIVAGPDGNLWFNDMGTPKAIGRITPSGAVTEFTAGLNVGSAPADLAAGADGNVWFGDRGTSGAIGRITSSGTITEFSSGLAAGSSPRGLAAGPDGNIWFGDDGTTKAIGRITPGGTITEFTTGLSAGSSPTGLATGPDGNVWFTDKGSPKAIGRITPSGTITEFSLPATSAPADIEPGADGNLWFTDQGTPKAIGRITPSGTITEFTTGLTSSNLPNGIAPGADGNVWFADRGTGATPVKAIGRITPSGTITEFSMPGTSSPRGVSPGADGNLWFTDAGTPKQIGQFGLGAPAASVTAPAVTANTGLGGEGIAQACGGDVWSSWAGQQPSHDAYGFDGYQWLLDGSPIAGATTQSYTPTVGDMGHQLSCKVTVTYTLLAVTVSATSAAVTVVDVTPPVLTVPSPIIVDATSLAGATVSYTATATDNVDPSPVVSCVPASGSTFPIGTTTVNCTATDASQNVAHGSFTVQVKGASEQLGELADAVSGVGPGASLGAKIDNAQATLAGNHVNATCGMLSAFINQVNAQSGKSISSGTAVSLITDTTRIETVLGC